jgi:hypothetical protein
MGKPDFKKAQAAIELAVFGAILIFILGTIVRSALSNSYMQNQNFKAMRMAMMSSWQDSTAKPGFQQVQVTAHNSASILFLEDRLSPDFNKYGPMDRTPFIANGSGSFSYNLLYPLSAVDVSDMFAALPVMDVYIDGQHFPFQMASWVQDLPLKAPFACNTYPAGSCQQNQCLRNQREWAGGIVKESQLITPAVASTDIITGACLAQPTQLLQRECQEAANACLIFNNLITSQVFSAGSPGPCTATSAARINPLITTAIQDSAQWNQFVLQYESAFNSNTQAQNNVYLSAILQILNVGFHEYKLFYTIVPNPGAVSGGSGGGGSGGGSSGGTPAATFSTSPPSCPAHPCANKELSSDVPLLNYNNTAITTDGYGNTTNINGVMEYDLQRNANYGNAADPLSVFSRFPIPMVCTDCMRNYISWQWGATAGTTAAMIGLNTTSNIYPTYDIDGRLKEVTLFNIWQDSGGVTHVSFEDSNGGDIDGAWDITSCGPKPGLQQDMQMYTFTGNGTYLQILEGKLYNPETQQVVRSVSKRDTLDLIQRKIQLSNNTGRFCTATSPTQLCSGNQCANPNPVEVCVDESSGSSNCFTNANIALTCYDTSFNTIFVRARLQDLRGRFWITDTTGRLQVH